MNQPHLSVVRGKPFTSEGPSSVPSASAQEEKKSPRWIAAALGVGWFFWLGGGEVIDPRNVQWMMREDWLANLFGWLFFRDAPWKFPLGSAPGLLYPYGTSVALTDGHPLLAMVFKACSPLLPLDFQYLGLWLALCFALLGYFGARLTAVFTSNRLQQILGGLLCVLSPILPARFGHPTLCAQWLLVAMIWLCVRHHESEEDGRQALKLSLLFTALSSGFHVYWTVMMLALDAALIFRVWRMDRMLTASGAAIRMTLCVASVALGFFAFGYVSAVGGPSLQAEGFGQFSSDLTALVSSAGWSRILPALPMRPRQGEGFGYLGLGAMGLVVFALVSLVLRRQNLARHWLRFLPAFAAALALAIFAWSSQISWLGQPVLNLSAFYDHLGPIPQWFRSSGRFIWPFHFVILCSAISSVALWSKRPWAGTTALALAVVLQMADMPNKRSPFWSFRPVDMRMNDPAWELAAKDYQHVALFPVQAQWICGFDEDKVARFSHWAYLHMLTINSGYAARMPEGISRRCSERMQPHKLDPRTLYIVDPTALASFRASRALCSDVEGEWVCVHPQRETDFQQELLARNGSASKHYGSRSE